EYRAAAAAPMDDSLGRDLHWTCHDLGIDRLMSLSRGCRRAVYRCNAIGVEGDQRFLDRNASAGGLDNHCAADAPQPPALRRLGAPLFETVPVRKPLGFGKQTLEVAAIVAGWNWTRRDGVGELVAADEIPSPQFYAVHAEPARRLIDEALDHIGHVRTSGPAIGGHRDPVGEDKPLAA